MILLELNEANIAFLRHASIVLNLKHIKKVVNLSHVKTTTDETRERYGLDPWTQWVSIHTGKSIQDHKVKHLDQKLGNSHSQVWDILTENGLTCAVWGPPNARIKKHQNLIAFLPDLWNSESSSVPNSLKHFLALPKHYARHYSQTSKYQLIKASLPLFTFFIKQPIRLQVRLLSLLPWVIKHAIVFGVDRNNLSVLFELISSEIFLSIVRTKKPHFSILFLNLIAHAQHHYWKNKHEMSTELKSSFIVLDKILGKVLKHNGAQGLLIMNGLAQEFIGDQNKHLYRQKNVRTLMLELGIKFKSTEQLMTNDGYIYFENQTDMKHAIDTLEAATVDNTRLFDTDIVCLTKNKLFFQLVFWKQTPKDTYISLPDRNVSFTQHFESLGIYTGSHIPEGDLFYQGVEINQSSLQNHQVFDVIINYFNNR